ncbi:PA domain protein [Luteitalea pratensis]|uniref:PA domain protein n=1 Tax=Luteitalea pratensis TaxID=1855912 RepID=A0A143PRZ8_LUTPR|nr:PA domain-containing protein [Luteitalea pratensis]AMY11106.1 PA domain protein [Luteitalea pratensis]
MTSRLAPIALALFAVAAPAVAQPARIAVVNVDGPGVGFNDPTPADPVGGNPGTTRGQQALNVFQHAANRWAANLQSKQLIIIVATFTPLTCSPTGAVLGAAGPNWYFANVDPANGGQSMEADTWYPVALAEKLTRVDITADPSIDPADAFEIFTLFNSQLGIGTCLTGNGWYFGLDNNQPANRIDLLAVVMHEFGHGLGVTVGPTNTSTSGARPLGFPSVWEGRMLDLTSGKRWIDMTNAERFASARNTNNLVWAGQQVTNVIPSTLEFQLWLTGISPAIAPVQPGPSSFGPPIARGVGLKGYVVSPADGGGTSPQDGCEAFPAGAPIPGNIVLVNRGTCTFNVKVKNAQDAGAIGVLIANNVAGPLFPGGTDLTITIPSLGITQALGTQLRSYATPPLVQASLDSSSRQGTTAGFARLFAPNPFQSGSSVSHFDVTLTPSVLMEPNITSDLTTKVKNPFDLTLALLRDIGW